MVTYYWLQDNMSIKVKHCGHKAIGDGQELELPKRTAQNYSLAWGAVTRKLHSTVDRPDAWFVAGMAVIFIL